MSRIIALDISGNFKEGKGTTGICVMDNGEVTELNEIRAKDFGSAEEYWWFHLNYIDRMDANHVVVEGYKLYNHAGKQASMQTHSILETPQLLGCIRLHCYAKHQHLVIQYASDVKNRWKEDILVHKGYLETKGDRYLWKGKPTNAHKRDALKHALHFYKYGKRD